MQTDPVLEWRRLSDHYRSMSEMELLELASSFSDLTETARQVLRAEFQSRGLGDPESALAGPPQSAAPAPDPKSIFPSAGSSLDDSESEMQLTGQDSPSDDDSPHDYTWKTYLCESETKEQALQLCEMLRRSGIDAWVESSELVYPRVIVAADQLEQAQDLAARPIPQEIIDDSKAVMPEYVAPRCPQCGADDPTLDSPDPVNTWRCEQCGKEWTEKAGPENDEAEEADYFAS